jgi:hypothetical protein
MLYSFYRYIVVLPLLMKGRARGGNAEPVVRYALASDCFTCITREWFETRGNVLPHAKFIQQQGNQANF